MKRNIKINIAKFLVGSLMLSGIMTGGSIDLTKNLGSSAISSISSVLEPMIVYGAEEIVQVGNFKLKFDTSTGEITNYVSGSGHLEIPEKINGVTVKSIGGSAYEPSKGAFYFCSNLTSVSIPDSVIEIGLSAFEDCPNLTSISIGNGVSYIGMSAFYKCKKLTSINLPNSVTKIDMFAFTGCESLESISIPDKVTSISDNMFWGCGNLISISIPISVTSIEASAFGMCSNLKDVYYGGSQDDMNKIEIISSWDNDITLTSATWNYNSIDPLWSESSSFSIKQPPSAPKIDGIIFKIGETSNIIDIAPYIENGNTMIPVRAMANLLGISDTNIIYDNATQKVTIIYYERVISLTIGENKIYVTEDGINTTKIMDNNAKAVIKEGRTFVPFRALSEVFGLQVSWDNNTQTVTLKS